MNPRLNRGQAEDLLKALTNLVKAQSLYPAGHAAIAKSQERLAQVLQKTLSLEEPVLIGVAEGYLVVGDVAFLGGPPQAQEWAQRLQDKEVEAVTLKKDVRASDVIDFVRWLRSDDEDAWTNEFISLSRLQREDGSWERAVRVHKAAADAMEEAYREAQEGRIPDTQKARACVKAFSELLSESPSIVKGLVLIKDYDRYTFFHSVNVCLLALGIGRHVGLGTSESESLGFSALFHDIGKTRLPAKVVRKPGRLTQSEWALIMQHPAHGRDVLLEMDDVPADAPRAVYEHHIRFDGGGYPELRPGGALGPLSPFVTVADIYDAMTTHRPYSAPMPLPEAVRTILKFREAHCDPVAVDAFLAVVGQIPVGSVVRLASGEAAVVTRVGQDREVAEVRVVVGLDGRRFAPSESSPRKVSPSEVIRWIDPLAHGIDPVEVLRNTPSSLELENGEQLQGWEPQGASG